MAEATETSTPASTTPATTPAAAAPVETKTEASVPGPGESLLPKTEASTEAPVETKTDGENKLIFGKYKTMEEAEKGYKNALAMKTKGPAVEVPEAYDFVPVTEQGLAFESEEHQTQIAAQLKEAGVPQDMLAKLAPISKDLTERAFKAGQAEVMQRVVDTYGEPLDKEKELGALRQAWGDDYETELQAAREFKAKLPPELFSAPLDRSAAGLKFLREYQKQVRGVDFIRESTPASVDSMKAEINDLMKPGKDSAYWNSSHPNHAAVHKKVAQLQARLHPDD